MATGDLAELDELSTEELRQRAFALARQRHDRGFFWDVLRHLPHNQDATVIDESSGGIGEFVDEVVGLWREFTGHLDYGDSEPLMRAKFIDYLSSSS
jgi:hypothetical protein